MSWIYVKKYSMNFDQTLQRHGRGIELSKNIKILVTYIQGHVIQDGRQIYFSKSNLGLKLPITQPISGQIQ